MPKYATIGDYWDEEMVSKVTELLHEYQGLFPTKFSEMKEKVRMELDKMLVAGIIEPIEEILSWC